MGSSPAGLEEPSSGELGSSSRQLQGGHMCERRYRWQHHWGGRAILKGCSQIRCKPMLLAFHLALHDKGFAQRRHAPSGPVLPLAGVAARPEGWVKAIYLWLDRCFATGQNA